MGYNFDLGFLILLLASFQGSINCSRPTLRVAGYGIKPYIDLNTYEEGMPKGIDPDILRLLSKSIGFDYIFNETDAWGHIVNNKWVGTVGEIVSGNADVGIGLISYNYKRYQSIDYTTALYQSVPIFISSKPKPLPQHFNVVKPFSAIAWTMIMVTLAVTIIAVAIVASGHSKWSLSPIQRMELTWLTTFGLLLQQSMPRLKLSPVSRVIVTICWLFFCTIICMSFECKLRAFLIAVDYEKEINTAEDIFQMERPYYTLEGSGVNFVFQTSPSMFDREITKNALANKRFIKFNQGYYSPTFLEELKETSGAMFSRVADYPSLAKQSIGQFGYNPFRKGTHNILTDFKAFILPKKSPWTERFNVGILRIVDGGIVEKLFTDHSPFYIESEDGDNKDVPLSLEHLFAASIPLIAGWMCSGLCFCIELATTKLKRKHV